MITGEITEAEQERLDRYKRRRDEYIRRLVEVLSDDAEGWDMAGVTAEVRAPAAADGLPA